MGNWLLVIHIAVLGYWLGAELVINSTYRRVCFDHAAPIEARSRLMEHVMHVDQHVRYALALQATLGTALAARFGYFDGGESLVHIALIAGIVWLGFIEAVHRLRHSPVGTTLALFDRSSRYVLIVLLIALAFGLLAPGWPIPTWLRIKLTLFAGVIGCGIGIRFALLAHFRTWATMVRDGPTAAAEAAIRQVYARATGILVVLWLQIAAIVVISVDKTGSS